MNPIAEFERIETIVKNGSIGNIPIAKIREERDLLLRNSPTSNNPQFAQRWERVHLALTARIESNLAWWQKPLGVIAIAVISAVLSAAVTAWLGLT
jgi:hypothetical protein